MTQKTNPNDDNHHQQQILFTDHDLADDLQNQPPKESADGKQILFDNQDYLPIEDTIDSPTPESSSSIEYNKENTKNRPRWLWRITIVLLTVIIAIEGFDFFTNGFAQSPIITSIYAAILACLVIIASSSVLSEWSTLRQFKRREKVKQQAKAILSNNQSTATAQNTTHHQAATINIELFCEKITDNLPSDLRIEQAKQQAWQNALNNQHTRTELLQLYSRLMLSNVDDKAMAEIARFSTEAVVLVALSPVAIIDMLIILWRNLRMINKVAALYGLKLGYWSRIKLLKQVFINMVYAGTSELIADFGTEVMGADLLGKLSGRLAQGLGAGMLTARLGVKTMQLCRPIPFENKPKLSQVRKEMLTTIKSLMQKS